MSVPTTGYPDYQRLSAQAGDVISFTRPVVNGSFVLADIDCHGYGYLNVSVNSLGGSAYFSIQLLFSISPGDVDEVATFEFLPTPGGEQTLQFPVIARYCRVLITWIAGVKTDQPGVCVFGSNALAPSRMTSMPGKPLIYFNGGIAAGGEADVSATTTFQGPAILTLACSGNTAWSLFIKYYDAASAAFLNYMEFLNTGYGQAFTTTISIPPAPFAIAIDNGDTAAHSFHVSVTPL